MNSDISRRTVISNISSLIIGTVFTQVFTALAVFLTARSLGSESYGAYVGCFALTKLTSILFTLGLDTWLLREAAYDRKRAGEYVSSVLNMKAKFGVIWLLAITFFAYVLGKQLYPPFLLFLSAITTWLESGSNSVFTGYKSQFRNRASALISSVAGFILLAITLVLIYINEDRVIIFLTVRLGISLSLLLYLVLSSRKYLFLKWVKTSTIKFWTLLWPYCASEGLFLVYMYADVTIITLLLGKSSAGVYGAATNIISAIYTIPLAVYTVLLPAISKLYSENDVRILTAIKNSIRYSVFLGFALSVITYVLGPYLISLVLGAEYLPSVSILKILSFNIAFKTLSLNFVSILTAAGYQKSRLFAQAISAAISILLNFILIQSFGLQAAAWIYVFSEFILVIGYAVNLPKVILSLRIRQTIVQR